MDRTKLIVSIVSGEIVEQSMWTKDNTLTTKQENKMKRIYLMLLLSMLSFNAAAATLGNISLSWESPAGVDGRQDNSELLQEDIAGYKIYYGNVLGNYQNSLTINDGLSVGYVFSSMPTGDYYFVLTTFDTEGRESVFSTTVDIHIKTNPKAPTIIKFSVSK